MRSLDMPAPVSPAFLDDAASVALPPAGSGAVVPLDPLVVNPGRLSILLALNDAGRPVSAGPAVRADPRPDSATGADGVEFVDLRRRTRLTDGNLACHAKRLAAGGLIDVAKRFRAGKPVTTYLLTTAGRGALETHVRALTAALRSAGDEGSLREAVNDGGATKAASGEDGVASATVLLAATERDEDDWVD